jgi:Fe-S cluster assembly protein SufD
MIRPSPAADTQNLLAFFQAEFGRFDADHASDPSWLRTVRRKAAARLSDRGFPTPRDEEWRFTPLAELFETPFGPAPAATEEQAAGALVPGALSFDAPIRLVFVNGRYARSLSTVGALPAGVSIGSLAVALATRPDALGFHLARTARYDAEPFRALNTAFLHDGAVVEIPPNVVVEGPIHLLFLSADAGVPAVSHPRTLVVVGENSQVRIVESYAGPDRGGYFTNPVTEVVVGAGAVADHVRVQVEGDEAFHIGSTQATIGRQASYSSHAVTFGASISRCDIAVTLSGEGATCTLNGLYLASGDQVVDHHTTIDHARPHCSSHELYKGILGGQARAVFSGKIVVRPDAQKTDAKQTNKTLLLSDEAQINTKPQLEILANDVKCTHGATVGQLSGEALFYLRTRGLGRDEARRMLIHAFAGDVLGRLPLEPVRARLEALLAARLDRASGTEASR